MYFIILVAEGEIPMLIFMVK